MLDTSFSDAPTKLDPSRILKHGEDNRPSFRNIIEKRNQKRRGLMGFISLIYTHYYYYYYY
jgi:hypothetical protein